MSSVAPPPQTPQPPQVVDADDQFVEFAMAHIEKLSSSTLTMLHKILRDMAGPCLRRRMLYEFITMAEGGLEGTNRVELKHIFRILLSSDWRFDIYHKRGGQWGKSATRWMVDWTGPCGARNQTKLWKEQYNNRLLPIIIELSAWIEDDRFLAYDE
jgi:hypothetical protein